jgi:murein L,D-transpeptidase YcbB/YkuD
MDKSIETIISELENEERQLEAESKAFHAERREKGKIDFAKLQTLNERREALESRKSKAQEEKRLKEQYRREYAAKSALDPAQFDALWESSLKQEAFKKQVENVLRSPQYARKF